MIDIIEYMTEMGVCPYRQYIESIKDRQALSQVLKAVNKMEAGLLKDTRSLGDGLQEYKIDTGAGHRIYFYRDGQILIVLLAGSTKSDQKREIKNAHIYLDDYKRQKRADKEKVRSHETSKHNSSRGSKKR